MAAEHGKAKPDAKTVAQAQADSCDLILRAVAFAAHKHRDQRRKDKDASPYINHPIQLATVLWEEGGVRDAEVIAAALLHDTLEDTETSLQELRGEFGEEIAAVVLEVTDTQWIKKQVRKRLQVARAKYSSGKARLVKLADKICNLRDIAAHPPAGWALERKRQYFDWAKEVVDQLRGTHAGLEQKFDEVYALKP
ncbi:MAG: HD domain-containing protein [Burkholderiales bacterium]|nr:HD domain-containing protein [Burkholderiales bacterium]